MRRTFEQQRAIETGGRLTLVAGAGAGKTGVLTERFAYLVTEKRAPVDSILTITFTRKATAEMKTRIARELEARGLREERRQVENAYIQTVHAFCRRLLQENPFEAGVDPDSQTLDQRAAQRLQQQAFTYAIASLLTHTDKNEPESAGMRELIAIYLNQGGGRAASADPLFALREMATKLSNSFRNAGLDLDDLSKWQNLFKLSAREQLKQLIQQELTDWTLKLESQEDEGEPFQKVVLDSLKSYHAKFEDPHMLAIVSHWSSLVKGWNEREEERGLSMQRALLRLAYAAAYQYELMKQNLSVIDYEDMALRTLKLLRDSPTVRKRYQRQFRYVMVDEFQDIDPLQAQIIEHLAGNSDVMVVGDLQQSIYRFRGADPRVFERWIRQAKDRNETIIEMHDNFRACPHVLQFVEGVFSKLWEPHFRPPLPVREAMSLPMGSEYPVQVWSHQGSASDEARLIAETIKHWVSEQSLTVIDPETHQPRPAIYGDFALIFNQFTKINHYERAFKEMGVPAFVVGGGRGYWLRHEVRDLVNLLKVMEDPDDTLAWMSLLYSPMAGLSLDALTLTAMQQQDQQISIPQCLKNPPPDLPAEDTQRLQVFLEWFEPLQREAHIEPVARVMARALERSGYERKLLAQPDGAQQVANVRKLWSMAMDQPDVSLKEFIQLMEMLNRVEQREGNAPTHEEQANVVRFITTHTAKGLEFPVVFLADTGFRPRPKENRMEADLNLRLMGVKWSHYATLPFVMLNDARTQEEEQESQRALYVAMTRARDYLIVMMGSQANNPWSKALLGATRKAHHKPTGFYPLGNDTEFYWRNIKS